MKKFAKSARSTKHNKLVRKPLNRYLRCDRCESKKRRAITTIHAKDGAGLYVPVLCLCKVCSGTKARDLYEGVLFEPTSYASKFYNH